MLKTAAATLCCLIALVSIAHADTPLEISMKATEKAYKQLKLDLVQPIDASKPDYLALVATLKGEAQKDRDLVPKKVDTLPADQQAAMVTAYQKSMDDLAATYDVLSQQIQAGQWDDARKTMAKVLDQERSGHKEFRIHKGDPTAPPAPAASTPAPAPMQ